MTGALSMDCLDCYSISSWSDEGIPQFRSILAVFQHRKTCSDLQLQPICSVSQVSESSEELLQ